MLFALQLSKKWCGGYYIGRVGFYFICVVISQLKLFVWLLGNFPHYSYKLIAGISLWTNKQTKTNSTTTIWFCYSNEKLYRHACIYWIRTFISCSFIPLTLTGNFLFLIFPSMVLSGKADNISLFRCYFSSCFWQTRWLQMKGDHGGSG